MGFRMGIAIGDRVDVGGHRGTVRFCGTVEGYSGEWAGIEWDEPSRGKHDGVVKGIRYFSTSNPTGGSLVRLNLVRGGEDLATEVEQRYSSDENNSIDALVLETDKGSVPIDNSYCVKAGRKVMQLGRTHKIRNIVLDRMMVSFSSARDQPLFPYCTELNLFGNLLSRWSSVMECLQQTPRCEELLLSRNKMEAANDVEALSNLPRSPLKRLILNYCGISENTISCALCLFPQLQELFAARNSLHTFSLPPCPPPLTLVDIEFNPIGSIDNIVELSRLKSLRKLSLASCGIPCVDFRGLEDANGNIGFENLEILNLKGNVIHDWPSIDELARLPSLRTLFIDYPHFKAEFGMDPREIIIAKIAKLENLERCELSTVERRSAEIRFLNKYSALSAERRTAERWEHDLQRLEKVHGPAVLDNAKSKQLTIVKLVFVKDDKSLPPRPVPTTLSVAKLADMARKLFALGRDDEISMHLDQSGHHMPLDNPIRQLAFYGPQNGDLIRVQ